MSDRRAPRLETVSALGRAPARIGPRPAPPPPVPPPEEPRSLWQRTRAWVHGALVDNLVLKFVSLILALTVFILVNTDREREIVARVGVSYTLPDDKVLVSERIDEVQVTVRGPWRRIKRFDEREVDRVHVDLTKVSGGEVSITPDQIHLPAGLHVSAVAPRFVRVAFERREVKEVDVVPSMAGRPMHGFTVAETKIDPPRVTVRGPEGVVHALPSVRTQEIRIDGRSETFEVTPLLVPPEGVDVEWEGPVSVQVQIDEQLVTRRVGPLAVALSGVDTARFRAEPSEVKAILTGGLRAVEKALEQGVIAVARPLPGGPRTVPVVVDKLPPGVGVQVVPAQITVVPRR